MITTLFVKPQRTLWIRMSLTGQPSAEHTNWFGRLPRLTILRFWADFAVLVAKTTKIDWRPSEIVEPLMLWLSKNSRLQNTLKSIQRLECSLNDWLPTRSNLFAIQTRFTSVTTKVSCGNERRHY